MGIITALLPLSILLGLAGLCAYLWAIRNGQYRDLDTPAMRALLDDETLASNDNSKSKRDRSNS